MCVPLSNRLCCSCWATTTGLRFVMRRRPVVFFEAPVQHPLLGKWACQLSSFAGGGDWAAACHARAVWQRLRS